MRTFLIDSNVLLDIATLDADWFPWSSQTLERCADEGLLAINPIIFAEVSVGFESEADLEEALPEASFERLPLPFAAAFAAGKCFLTYRRRGGKRTAPLPDFYIGAHAVHSGLTLVTRDATRYRTYFPGIRLIAP